MYTIQGQYLPVAMKSNYFLHLYMSVHLCCQSSRRLTISISVYYISRLLRYTCIIFPGYYGILYFQAISVYYISRLLRYIWYFQAISVYYISRLFRYIISPGYFGILYFHAITVYYISRILRYIIFPGYYGILHFQATLLVGGWGTVWRINEDWGRINFWK